MTSSLVGSEMCIRDSLRKLPRRKTQRCLSFGPNLVRRMPLAPLLLYGPVSYTHLTLPTICSV
eukprot:6756680-Prorocentrum_lima.AAC.1